MNLFAHGEKSAEKHSFFLLKNFFKKVKISVDIIPLPWYDMSCKEHNNKNKKQGNEVNKMKKSVYVEKVVALAKEFDFCTNIMEFDAAEKLFNEKLAALNKSTGSANFFKFDDINEVWYAFCL